MYAIDFKLINGYNLKNWFFKMILRINIWRRNKVSRFFLVYNLIFSGPLDFSKFYLNDISAFLLGTFIFQSVYPVICKFPKMFYFACNFDSRIPSIVTLTIALK